MLLTYLLNIIAIVVMLYLDGIAHKFAVRRAHDIRAAYADMGAALRAVFLLGIGFTRTGMYIFYIVALILSRFQALRPDLMPFALGDFFASIEYGIILLFAFDTLKGLFAKDRQWFDEKLRLK